MFRSISAFTLGQIFPNCILRGRANIDMSAFSFHSRAERCNKNLAVVQIYISNLQPDQFANPHPGNHQGHHDSHVPMSDGGGQDDFLSMSEVFVAIAGGHHQQAFDLVLTEG